jgi:hypothetical protein
VPEAATTTRLAIVARENIESERKRAEFNADATTLTEDMKEPRVGVWFGGGGNNSGVGLGDDLFF